MTWRCSAGRPRPPAPHRPRRWRAGSRCPWSPPPKRAHTASPTAPRAERRRGLRSRSSRGRTSSKSESRRDGTTGAKNGAGPRRRGRATRSSGGRVGKRGGRQKMLFFYLGGSVSLSSHQPSPEFVRDTASMSDWEFRPASSALVNASWSTLCRQSMNGLSHTPMAVMSSR